MRSVAINTKLAEPFTQKPVGNRIVSSKYTILSFLPVNLMEQFKRVANTFFLAIIVLQTLPQFSVTSVWSQAAPLCIIVGLTAVKNALEDYQRHKADGLINNRVCYTLPLENHNTHIKPNLLHVEQESDKPFLKGWSGIHWQDLQVGDWILLQNNDAIPADAIALATSNPDGLVFVETKNLDGETNLKSKEVLTLTSHLETAQDCSEIKLMLEVEPPNLNLYTMTGRATLLPSNDIIAIQPSNLLLRGSSVRNVDWVIAVIIYSGPETKVLLNGGKTPSKISSVEKVINLQVAWNFFLLLLMSSIIATFSHEYFQDYVDILRNGRSFKAVENQLIAFGVAILMLQNVIPISLYVCVESGLALMAYFLFQDKDMYYEETQEGCKPKSWNIIEDLGQIQYVFSDKTGTLTQNKMVLAKFSIGDRIYGQAFNDVSGVRSGLTMQEQNKLTQERRAKMTSQMKSTFSHPYPNEMSPFVDETFFEAITRNDKHAEAIKFLLLMLAVCHTVPNPEPDSLKGLKFAAQSPDEEALVSGAKDVGYIFHQRIRDQVSINAFGHTLVYTLLDVIEFNSTRKRMSVLVRDSLGHIILMTKGADNVILERLAASQSKSKKDAEVSLKAFSNEGLRTLCFAYRKIPEKEYASWSQLNEAANLSMTEREKLMDEAAILIEKDLILAGTTAIEDKLQDGVPETIANLSMAGIKVWVLTGDKLETAVNIGYASNLLSDQMTLLIISATSTEEVNEQLQRAFQTFEEHSGTQAPFSQTEYIKMKRFRRSTTRQKGSPNTFGLVIDGASLGIVFQSGDIQEQFLQLALLCSGVICCRVSPKQKALVVTLVKESLGVMTLAIGDGANDVSMIQAAEVGVGISGKEGLQAAMASDFTISQFRFLSKLLFTHGHWVYYRISQAVLNFFYKALVWILAMFFYQIISGFTEIILYDYTLVLLFNVIFTSLPPFAFGFFDRDISLEASQKYPQLYQVGMRGDLFNMKRFALYIFIATYHSVVCLFIPYFAMAESHGSAGYSGDLLSFSTAVAINVVLVTNLCMAVNMSDWNVISIVAYVLSGLSLLVYIPFYGTLFTSSGFHGTYQYIYADIKVWLGALLSIVLCIGPLLVARMVRNMIYPTDTTIVNEMESVARLAPKSRKKQMEIVPDEIEVPSYTVDVEPVQKSSEAQLSEISMHYLKDDRQEKWNGYAFAQDDQDKSRFSKASRSSRN